MRTLFILIFFLVLNRNIHSTHLIRPQRYGITVKTRALHNMLDGEISYKANTGQHAYSLFSSRSKASMAGVVKWLLPLLGGNSLHCLLLGLALRGKASLLPAGSERVSSPWSRSWGPNGQVVRPSHSNSQQAYSAPTRNLKRIRAIIIN